jgi:hypothetical protein
MMAYQFTADEIDADPAARRLSFGGGERYFWMQRDDDAYDDGQTSPDASYCWVELEDQRCGGLGGIARVRLERDCLSVWRTLPLSPHAGGHEWIVIHFDVENAEFALIKDVLREALRGSEHVLEIAAEGP